jgi:diguanylate cyclase (GGDEF)-like protein
LTAKLPFYRRIVFRLIAVIGIGVLIGALTMVLVSIQLARHEFFHVMERQFNSASRLAENSLDIIGQMARAWAFYFAATSDLGDRMREGEHAPLAQEIERLREGAHCDTIIVLDDQGRIIQHSAFDDKGGDSLMSWQIVRQAVNEKKASYAIVEEAGNFIIYGSGIKLRRGAVSYIVLAGFRISDQLVAKLSQDTSIGLTFVRRTAVMTSSFNTAQRRLIENPVHYLDYQNLYDDPRLTKEVDIDGQGYYASVRPLHLLEPAMDGSLLLTYPRRELYSIIERMQRNYLWLSLGGMLLFSMFVWRIAHRLMAPLRKLAERVKQVAEGDMTPTVIERRDEIGSIASSFNDLLSELVSSKQKIERHAQDMELVVEQRTCELRIANEELIEQATHDALTGLPNRKLFHDRLHQAIVLAHRANAGMALMFIDLDRFKWVNDTLGHAAGDALLSEVSTRVQSCIREGDTVARLGGDEFVVILSQTGTTSNVEEVAARILQELVTPFDLPGGADTQISGSIGIALYPEHGETETQLLQHADQAMYHVKNTGRGGYHFWHSEA